MAFFSNILADAEAEAARDIQGRSWSTNLPLRVTREGRRANSSRVSQGAEASPAFWAERRDEAVSPDEVPEPGTTPPTGLAGLMEWMPNEPGRVDYAQALDSLAVYTYQEAIVDRESLVRVYRDPNGKLQLSWNSKVVDIEGAYVFLEELRKSIAFAEDMEHRNMQQTDSPPVRSRQDPVDETVGPDVLTERTVTVTLDGRTYEVYVPHYALHWEDYGDRVLDALRRHPNIREMRVLETPYARYLNLSPYLDRIPSPTAHESRAFVTQ